MEQLINYFPLILDGMVLTVLVAIFSLIIAVCLGMITAISKLSQYRSIRFIAGIYTTVIRGIPELVMLTVVFFGGQILINNIGAKTQWWGYVDLSPFTAGVLTLGFIYGAYMGETFRGAILAVDKGEIEAGRAYGMRSGQLFVRITLPAMIRHALPGFGNNWLVLIKATALVSTIGLHDMVFNASMAGGSTRQPFLFLLLVAFLFLLITAVSNQILKWLNQRYMVGVK